LITARLQELEMRINRVEQAGGDHSISELQSRLAKELERSQKLGQQLVFFAKRCGDLETQYENASRQLREREQAVSRKFWNFWGKND
jgi:hypothetical protein